MRTNVLDSAAKRMAIMVAMAVGIVLIAVGVYTFFGGFSSKPANGLKIIAAARAYTQALRQNHQPVPPSVSLQVLIDKGLLDPADIGALQGVDATLSLTATNGASNVLMHVHLPDGTDYVLMADGAPPPVKK